eukprot:NODE_108_length_18904_cov_0.654826.p4 type:complete len:440 gc:universal NODE_108_length_18904_cov_0.654826:14065-15384(+)
MSEIMATKVSYLADISNNKIVLDIIGNSKYLNINLESLPDEPLIGLSSYLAYGSGNLENPLKRKPHPNYILQYQTEKYLFKARKILILHCGLLLDVLEPLLVHSWKNMAGLEFNDSIIPLISKSFLMKTIETSVVDTSEYRLLFEGATSLKSLFEDWNSQFCKVEAIPEMSSIYSKYIQISDLTACNSGFEESNVQGCKDIFNDFVSQCRIKYGMFKRQIMVIGTSESGKTVLSNRLSQYYELDMVTDTPSANPHGSVLDCNLFDVTSVSSAIENFKPNLIIILGKDKNDHLISIIEFVNTLDVELVFIGNEFYEFEKSPADLKNIVWPRDDFLFKDTRFSLWKHIIKQLKPSFCYDIPIEYKKSEMDRIKVHLETIKSIENSPIQELKYEIPETEYSKDAARTLEKVIPHIITGLKTIDLKDSKTVIQDLGNYLLAIK